MIKNLELLPMCSVCEAIRIVDEPETWLKKGDKYYDRLLQLYEKEISHTYCPEDFEKAMKEAEQVNKNYRQDN